MSVTFEQFCAAPEDWEGLRYGFAPCRACGNQIMVGVEWDGGPVAYSAGRGAFCTSPKCGDKFPDRVTRMATHDDVAFENVRCAMATAKDSGVPAQDCFDLLVKSRDVSEFRAALMASTDLAGIVGRGRA